jgi:predicted DNA-binding transcriptional regulator AlpA
LTKLLRFADLKERGILRNWPQYKRLQKLGFPYGRMLSANARVWTEAEVDEWIASRPVEGPALRGMAKIRHERRKAGAETASPRGGRRAP